jgi:hypothetical protein
VYIANLDHLWKNPEPVSVKPNPCPFPEKEGIIVKYLHGSDRKDI